MVSSALADIIMALGLITIGWAVWLQFGVAALAGYTGAILILIGVVLAIREMRQ